MAHCNSRPGISLVILAAGLGRRFGGDKPLAAMGDTGKPLMYFSVLDAWRAGIRRLVLVVNPAAEDLFRDRFLPILPTGLEVVLTHQVTTELPDSITTAKRDKPWGTGQALWCARPAVPGPMAVINADDYYGRDAFNILVNHFANSSDWAMASYPLVKTLSPSGTVNRGLCQIREDCLESISECHNIQQKDGGIVGETAGAPVTLAPETPVSMNIWAFDGRVFDFLKQGLKRFIQIHGSDDQAEYYLPDMVAQAIGENVRIRVYASQDDWFGITYREDLASLGALAPFLQGDSARND